MLACDRSRFIAISLIAVVVAGCGAESHPKADVSLLTFADGAKVVGHATDCSDLQGAGYEPNHICISYQLVEATRVTNTNELLVDQAALFARTGWRGFSAAKFAYTHAQGWADTGGHDCVVIGSPRATITSTGMLGPVPKGWSAMLTTLRRVQREHVALLGVVVYPGQANTPDHDRC